MAVLNASPTPHDGGNNALLSSQNLSEMLKSEKNASRNFLAANFLSQTADKLTILSLFSLIILFGPQGELLGFSSCLLLLPPILFSFLAGVLADKFNAFRLLNQSVLLRAGIVLVFSMLLPQSLDESQRCAIVATVLVITGSASAIFDICRLKVTPRIVQLSAMQLGEKNALAPLVRVNSFVWVGMAAAIIASSGLWLVTNTSMPWILLRLSVILYVGAYFAGINAEAGCTSAFRRKEKLGALPFREYLRRHRKAAKTLLVSAGVGSFSLAFFVCLTLFAWQGHRLSLTLMTDLLPSLTLGLLTGALAANRQMKRAGLTKITEGIALVLAVASIAAAITGSTSSFVVAQIGVFLLGAAASKSQILLDTLCQSIFPRPYRGRALGLRNCLQLTPLFLAAVYLENILPAVSLLPALRVISITALVFAVCMAFIWNDLIFLLARMFARAVLRLFFHLQIIDHSREIGNLSQDAESSLGQDTTGGDKHGIRRRTVILAGNHTGWLDPLILGAVFERRTRFIVMEEAMTWPIIGKLASLLGAIPLKRGHGLDTLKTAEKCLAKGDSVLIFPEGKLTKDGSIGEFQSGVARLQKDTRCPIIPFAISGGYEAWPRDRKLPRLAAVKIVLGHPLENKDLEDLNVEQIRNLLHERVQELKING